MAARRKLIRLVDPFPWDELISSYDSLDFEGGQISLGDKVRFRNRRGVFVFRGWVHNSRTDASWVNVFDPKSGGFRRFHLEELKGVVRPKRSRAKKVKAVA